MNRDNTRDAVAERLAYLSGPVDAGDVYERWLAGGHTSLFGTSYLQQFFDVCRELEAEALVITTLPGKFSRRHYGNVIIENRPPPSSGGVRYHLAMLWWMLALAPVLFRFRPSAMVITANQNYWFMLAYVKLAMRTEFITSAHCVMWRPYSPIPGHWKPLLWLDGLFLKRFVRKAMAVSQVAADQLAQLARSPRMEVAVLTPTYKPDHFANISPPVFDRRPFKVLFAGRTEINKGIFDLVQVAERLHRERPGEFVFDVCGTGSDLGRLQGEAPPNMHVHGFCDRNRLAGFLSASHVVVVPTRSDFEEGLPKTCAEAVLAGRPFVASPVCPLLSSLGDAAVAVPPDDAMAYHDAIVQLADDRVLYERKRDACAPLQSQFYDPARSYRSTLLRHIRAISEHRLRAEPLPSAAANGSCG